MFNELDWRSYIIRWRKVTGISLTFLEFDIFTLSAGKKENYLYLSVFVKMKVIWMSFYFSHHLILSWCASVLCLNPCPSPNKCSNYRLLLFGHQSTWHKRWPRLRIIFFYFHAGATIRRASTRYDLHFILKKERSLWKAPFQRQISIRLC